MLREPREHLMFTLRQLISAFVAPFILQMCVANGAAQDGPLVEVNPSGGVDAVDAGPPWRLPVKITLTGNAGYDDNADTSASNGGGSLYTSGGINLSYEFGTERTRASLSTYAGLTYYSDMDRSPFDPNVNLALSVRHAVNQRLSLTGSVDARYQIDPDFEIEGSLNRRSGNYFYNRDSISGTYLWLPRVSTVSTYAFGLLQYDEQVIGLERDYVNHAIAQQIRFLLLPVTALTAGHSLSIVSSDERNGSSFTNSLTAGVDQTIGRRLNGSLNVGAQFYSNDNAGGEFEESGTAVSPYFAGNLSYVVGAKTSLTWNGQYSIDEFSSQSGGGRMLTTGLRLAYSITARISATASANYRRYSNDRPTDDVALDTSDFSEDAFDVTIAGSYMVNRLLSANIGYQHTRVSADGTLGSYSRNRYFIGFSSTF